MNVSKFDLKKECVGCAACENICPQSAVSMEENNMGFYNPVISNKCIDCGLCVKVCQIDGDILGVKPSEVFAGKCLDDNVRSRSSSGEFFQPFAAN